MATAAAVGPDDAIPYMPHADPDQDTKACTHCKVAKPMTQFIYLKKRGQIVGKCLDCRNRYRNPGQWNVNTPPPSTSLHHQAKAGYVPIAPKLVETLVERPITQTLLPDRSTPRFVHQVINTLDETPSPASFHRRQPQNRTSNPIPIASQNSATTTRPPSLGNNDDPFFICNQCGIARPRDIYDSYRDCCGYCCRIPKDYYSDSDEEQVCLKCHRTLPRPSFLATGDERSFCGPCYTNAEARSYY